MRWRDDYGSASGLRDRLEHVEPDPGVGEDGLHDRQPTKDEADHQATHRERGSGGVAQAVTADDLPLALPASPRGTDPATVATYVLGIS